MCLSSEEYHRHKPALDYKRKLSLDKKSNENAHRRRMISTSQGQQVIQTANGQQIIVQVKPNLIRIQR